MSPHLPTAKQLFLDALELEPAARQGFLERACGAHPELARRVAALLAAHARADELDSALPGELRRRLHAGVRDLARRLGIEAR